MRLAALLAAFCLTLISPPLIAIAESPSPTPGPTGPPPGPKISPSGAPEMAAIDAALADEMHRVIAATSLAERIDAQRRLATAERDLLVREIARIRAEHAAYRSSPR